MTHQTEKLERGATLLAEANGDPDLLGVALLGFQGALHAQLRTLLHTNANLTAEDQALLADTHLAMPQLVDLARRYGDLSREQAWRILDTERLRTAFSAGEPFRGSPSEVRAYGRFAAELCGDTELANYLANTPTARLAPSDAINEAETDDDDDADPLPSGLYYTFMRWVPGILLVAFLAFGAWALLGRMQANQQHDPLLGAPAPEATAASVKSIPPDAASTSAPILIGQGTPTGIPSPTATARQARIVRLGGGPGWLHDAPRFDSPTLPIRLSEGQVVAILDQQATDAQGTLWVYVAIGGYEGWSPLNNIEAIGE